MFTKETFRKNAFYSKNMEDKIYSIEKYLDRNINSDKIIQEIFDEYTKTDEN